jgi:hypothetical protein
MREAWSKQNRVIPGLLLALEEAAVKGKREVTLQDLRDAAEKFRKSNASLELMSNLEVVPLATLVLTHKP